jgi:hypothetical protein
MVFPLLAEPVSASTLAEREGLPQATSRANTDTIATDKRFMW